MSDIVLVIIKDIISCLPLVFVMIFIFALLGYILRLGK